MLHACLPDDLSTEVRAEGPVRNIAPHSTGHHLSHLVIISSIYSTQGSIFYGCLAGWNHTALPGLK